MESLAYLYSAAAYESNEPVPELKPFDTLGSVLPSSAWISIQSLLAASLAISVTHSALAAATGVVSTTGNPLNVRSAPNGDVVGNVPDGSRVELTGRSQDGFLELTNGTWVATEWVSTTGTATSKSSAVPATSASPTRPPVSAMERTVAYIATAGEAINVRTAPGGQVVGTLPNATRVELTGRESQGYLERTNATWLDKRYVSANQPRVAQPAPVKAISPTASQAASQAIAPSPIKPVSQTAPPATAPATRSAASSQSAPLQVATSRTAQTVGYIRTTGNPINVRNAPGGQVISTLPNGTRVELTGRANTGFLERSNGTWLDQRYVAYTPPAASPVASPSPGQARPVQPSPAAVTPNPSPGSGISGSASTAPRVATVKTSGDPLNVRSAPGGAIVATVPNGSRVDLTGRRNGEWLEQTNGTWVASAWVTMSPSPTAAQPQPTAGSTPQPQLATGQVSTATIRTNGSPLNVRSSPGGALVGSVPNGSPVQLTGRRNGEWAERTDGTWVASAWVVPTTGTSPVPGVNPVNPASPGKSGSTPPVGSPVPAAVGGDVGPGTIRTNGSPLNVRSTPNGPVIGVVANGSRIELTGRNSGGWVQLGQGGWVSSEWVVR